MFDRTGNVALKMNYSRLLISVFLPITLLVSACTTVPETLVGEYGEATPAGIDPQAKGTPVRWGGVIVDAMPDQQKTCFEILSKNLNKYMRPQNNDTTAGRFIACKSGFHDPEVWTKGREVTLTGEFQYVEERKIGDFNYRYPVVNVDNLVLWQKRPDVVVRHYNYDPFYSPYYWGGRGGYGYGYGYGYRPGWGRYPYPYPMGHTRVSTNNPIPGPSLETSD